MFCNDSWSLAIFNTLQYGVFSPELPGILYYAHFTAIITSLAFAFFIFTQKIQSIAARVLLAIILAFATLSLLEFFIWILIDVSILMFLWSFWHLLLATVAVLSFYFLYTFIYERDVRLSVKLFFLFLLSPLAILSSTHYNLEFFDLSSCNAVEYFAYVNYAYTLVGLILIALILLGAHASFRKKFDDRRKIIYATLGILSFLLIFSVPHYYTSFINTFYNSTPETFLLEQYGYFGMAIFIGLLTYLTVKFRAFDIKLIATQALVIALVILTGSEFLFVRSQATQILIAVTFLLILSGGHALIKSVKREVQLREDIEKLARNLEDANEKLKELDTLKSQFLSIASHDLRAPLTVIRNFVSLMLEGAYGKIPTSAEDGLHQVFDRATDMAKSVDTYLNVSRIEQGRMKYDFVEAELLPLIKNSVTAFTTNAEKKGLAVSFTASSNLEGVKSKIDSAKINEVFNNLLDNSIKYTPKGSIAVSVEKRGTLARVSITDTGLGMSEDTMKRLFQLFSAGEQSLKVNISSTGIGLYITKAHVEAHGGKVWAESEGEGKGSTFIVELPLIA